jgi:CRP/FNR family transcriptional regulator
MPRSNGSIALSSQPALRDHIAKLSSELLQALHEIKTPQVLSTGATLFQQGSTAKDLYLVESGEVCILFSTGQGQRQLLEVVGPGSMLGLSEIMGGTSHRATAVARNGGGSSSIPREKLLNLLRGNTALCMEIVRLLSEELHGLYYKFRNISAHPGRPRRRDVNAELN